MKGIVKVEIEIPIEYDDENVKKELLKDLKEYFNARHNQTQHSSFSSIGCYSWKLPRKNAKVELIK